MKFLAPPTPPAAPCHRATNAITRQARCHAVIGAATCEYDPGCHGSAGAITESKRKTAGSRASGELHDELAIGPRGGVDADAHADRAPHGGALALPHDLALEPQRPPFQVDDDAESRSGVERG